ncbi:uncharacterized protein CTHT_0020520 [Thermochaetoides thermophila DSM 1495]|uniref:Uncharacterized protein n=1 Tax=Chaetomium thermophilum (strain DSM 1495 / CBS 144.50 / IMI 039719) TaxID=759272 RepID=G0S3C5_CHATD|nr:hypothetical protein CTHT_0020520 [Thermochaetoides thermophila DSM 1495]EGS22508.1 hypothetical protein CTHT_0020520 [Thermochaetoides thermophila DSM 1495]
MFVKHLTTILATLSLLLAFTTALPQSTTPVNPPSDFRANRWCSWCFKFPDAKNQSYCNIVVQTPGNINRYPNGYPAMVFNHNFQQLLWARDVGQFDTVHDIYFPAPQEKQAIGVHVLLVPSHRVNNTKEAPQIVYNGWGYWHDQTWTTYTGVPNADWTSFHTSFICEPRARPKD